MFGGLVKPVFCKFLQLNFEANETECEGRISVKMFFKIFAFFTIFYLMLISWGLETFPMADAETVVFTMRMPIDGFTSFFVKEALSKVLFPSLVIFLLVYGIWIWVIKTVSARKALLVLLFFCFLGGSIYLYEELPIRDYINVLNRDFQQPSHSVCMKNDFFRLSVDSVFRDSSREKRNLVLIIAESMENGFDGYVPELLNLSKNNMNFSPDGKFGGGIDIVGANSTTSSTVSKISGFPLLASNYSKLFPKIPTIYDVLRKYGYVNHFIQGTSGKFGFGGEFLVDHGVDYYEDDENLEKKGIVKYKDRITDKDLFDYAKKIIKQNENEPFSLTIATIETHFPYGFYDEKCREKPENPSDEAVLKATLRCSSRQISEFVSFVLNEKIAERTEIVILGDHLFKGKLVVQDYIGERSWLSIFINSSVSSGVSLKRKFTSIDMAPTILESMGFVLPQHKMAFGTSLFSDSKTLLEKIGLDSLNHEFARLTTSFEYNNLIVQKE